jgi:mono/diheme cytochrome c family protein
MVMNGSSLADIGYADAQRAMQDTSLQMPAWEGKLTEEEIRAIIEYLKSWWTSEQCATRRARFGAADC